MKLSSHQLEEDSAHYYIPQSEENSEFLYSPVSVGYFNCTPAYKVQRHNYNNYLLIIMLSGSLSYKALWGSGIVRPGYALLLDCHQPHSYRANGKCSFLFMHFKGAQSKEICEKIESTIGHVIRLHNSSPVHENIGEILNCMSNDKRISPMHASQLVYSVLMHLLSTDPVRSEGSTGHSTIDQALDYIHQHLDEKINVKDIATSIGYSESYFAHKFVETTGSTPYQFVMKCRIERAQQLLQTTNMSVQDIAMQTGFNSTANFSHAFKKEVGWTPHEFRSLPL